MEPFMNAAAVQRLESYFQRMGEVLGNESRRGSFVLYAMGLLGDAERKSVEPIAARACPDPQKVDAMHQRLLHFAVDSKWSDQEVRREAAQYALAAMEERESVEAWIVDDTGFLKQGTLSVGVQRQYTGSAGKIANCQVGVSLSIATRTEHLPIDFELYLPTDWANSPEPSPRSEALSVSELALHINERGGFRRCTWRKGTKEDLSARFALRRVIAAGVPVREQEPLWLLIEWRDGEPEPANYFLISLPERRTRSRSSAW
jgi:SRSO17 transposase